MVVKKTNIMKIAIQVLRKELRSWYKEQKQKKKAYKGNGDCRAARRYLGECERQIKGIKQGIQYLDERL